MKIRMGCAYMKGHQEAWSEYRRHGQGTGDIVRVQEVWSGYRRGVQAGGVVRIQEVWSRYRRCQKPQFVLTGLANAFIKKDTFLVTDTACSSPLVYHRLFLF